MHLRPESFEEACWTPVESLVKQIQDCVDYSEAGGVPIVPSQQINVGYAKIFATEKLLPLPQPPVRARTDARTNPSAQRATQLRRVLVRVYAVSIQNQITTTVPYLY
jgi:hypothetical protein